MHQWTTGDAPISIHALREEGDQRTTHEHWQAVYFYPRPPRGRRPRVVAVVADPDLFLSTPSARKATTALPSAECLEDISIHALREEGDEVCGADRRICEISIHALREEGDRAGAQRRRPYSNFYPRPPRGRRPAGLRRQSGRLPISIHALREEGDVAAVNDLLQRHNISIHALREEGD